MRISPQLGRISYGAAELKRVYNKNMAFAFVVSVALTLVLLSPLSFLVDREMFNPNPRPVVRIFKYSEIKLPGPLGDVEFGLSAYPILRDQNLAFGGDAALLSISSLEKKGGIRKKNIPKERTLRDGLNNLPAYGGPEKLSFDEKNASQNTWGNENAPSNRDDISGGSGASDDPGRKGGRPIAGKSGEPPSGVDRSGIGSSSKPSAEGTPYGYGDNGEGDGDGGGGFSMRWLQGLTRSKISGELPNYPSGINVSAQVKILATVLPDGTVKSVQPVQKANRLLEDAAMKSVRNWKFERLKSTLAQVEQSCIVTFYFKAK